MKRINLGCHDVYKKDYINVDINPDMNPDIIDDATVLEKFDDESLDEIMAHNMLEHLPQFMIEKTFTVWYKKLKKGGIIDVLVPDLRMFCILYLAGTIQEPWAFQALYSSSKSNNVDDWHKSGFSLTYVKTLLIKIGFKNIRFSGNLLNCELRFTAEKP